MRQSLREPGKSGDQSGYLSEKTIAALATAVGGAIAVIRISGPQASHCLDWLGGPGTRERAEPRKMTRITLRAPDGSPIDDALFVLFKNPESYTGEDVLEFHLHGGSFNSARVLELLAENGVRQALPGEFSFRAVRNGKLSINQAQAVADLISASNESAVTLALEKLSGAQNQLLSAIGSGLRQLAALGEIGIDFADQDVDEVSLSNLKLKLDPLIDQLQKLHSSFDRGSRIQDGIGLALLGLPNAGKSSFFNALLGEDRSIVSDIPGTTRDVVRERLNLRSRKGSVTLRIEDTAGLRASSDLIEQKGIERSLLAAQRAELVLFLVDPQFSDQAVHQEWGRLVLSVGPSLAKKTIGILTKSDLVPLSDRVASSARYQQTGIRKWLATSATTGQGVHQAAEEITDQCLNMVQREKGEVLLTRLDQVNAVGDAIIHLQRAKTSAEIDLFASDLRQALNALAGLIGGTLPDDILQQIFSEFCIGK